MGVTCDFASTTMLVALGDATQVCDGAQSCDGGQPPQVPPHPSVPHDLLVQSGVQPVVDEEVPPLVDEDTATPFVDDAFKEFPRLGAVVLCALDALVAPVPVVSVRRIVPPSTEPAVLAHATVPMVGTESRYAIASFFEIKCRKIIHFPCGIAPASCIAP
jgi:hypothetical protein